MCSVCLLSYMSAHNSWLKKTCILPATDDLGTHLLNRVLTASGKGSEGKRDGTGYISFRPMLIFLAGECSFLTF